MAKKLAAVHGHARLDWVLLLDPVATDVLACWQLVPSSQALWALQQRQRSEPRQQITGTWLGFKPPAPQRRWLLKHGAGARFVGL